jgi:uncharacterized membrane protein YdjX (TVP38/TMEM64 family)
MVPGPFFTVAAGFLFGIVGGLAVALCGSVTGAVLAFWIARWRPAERMRARMRGSARISALERFVTRGGWMVVLSTRLIPFFPFKVSNYFFGFIRFPFAPFFWGTLVGLVPATLVSVSAGALASDVSTLLQAEAPLPAGRWAFSLGGLLAAMVLFLWVARRARAQLRASSPPKDGEGPP